MNDAAFQQKKLTLMFTDIVGYSRLMGRDQAQTIAMLEDYRRILVEQITKQQGTIIEFIGDAVFARFDTAQAAVSTAIGIQKELFTFNHFRDKSLPRLQTRIGLHCGEVATKGEAVFGDDVNIAARLEPIAVADGICVSQAVYEEVKDELKEPVLKLGVQPLKNIESRIKAYLIRPLGITFKTRLHYASRKLNQKLGAYRYPIAAALVMVIISLIYWVPRWLVPGYDANYVEIADFKNLMNAGGEVDYLSAGITEAVRSQLADVRDVYLVKSGEGILAPIILEGSVQKIGDNLRIAYQLMRRDGNVQIAGGKLDGAYEDIFILQDRVTAEIAKYLADEFQLPNFRPAKIDLTSDVLAYEYYLRGLEYLNKPNSTNNADEAIKFFTTARVHDNAFAEAEAGICLAYRKKYKTSHDASWLERALSHCDTALKLDSSLSIALNALGMTYVDMGKYDEAISLLRDVLSNDNDNVYAASNLANAYFYSGDLNSAESLLLGVAKTQPESWLIYHTLGWLYLSSGKLEKAVDSYKKVLELTPMNNTALSNLGIAYSYQGKLDEALKAFEKAVEIVPSGWGYTNIGNISYYLGNFDKAIIFYQMALRLNPEDYVLYLGYAETLRQTGEDEVKVRAMYERSIELALKIYEVNASNPTVNFAIATSNIVLGNYDIAKIHLQRAQDVTPDDPDILYAKLRFEIAKENYREAMVTLDKLMKAGYSRVLIEKDPDLQSLKNQPQYMEIVAQN